MAHQFQQTTEDESTARRGNDGAIQLGWTTVTTATVLQNKTSLGCPKIESVIKDTAP